MSEPYIKGSFSWFLYYSFASNSPLFQISQVAIAWIPIYHISNDILYIDIFDFVLGLKLECFTIIMHNVILSLIP